MKMRFSKNKGFTFVELLILLVILFLLTAMDIPNYKRGGEDRFGYKRKCFFNILKIDGAIEEYASATKEIIKEFDDEIQIKLVKNEYLKEEDLVCSRKRGKYHSFGDLDSSDGFIYCIEHGNSQHQKVIPKPGMTMSEFKEAEERFKEAEERKSQEKERAELWRTIRLYTYLVSAIAVTAFYIYSNYLSKG